MKILYFPRWEFPNNLGDSCVFLTFFSYLKVLYPKHKFFIESDNHIQEFFPNQENYTSENLSLSKKLSDDPEENQKLLVYPSNSPNLFTCIRHNFDKFKNSSTVNFIILNYALQLGIEKIIFDVPFNTKFAELPLLNNKFFRIAIAPMTKKNGKAVPHPGCDGIGYRFNGPNGLQSWKSLLNNLRSKFSNIEFVEFSPTYLGLGDVHVGIQSNLVKLFEHTKQIDYAITNDGGYHHLFNLFRLPLTLFTGTKVAKPEFLALGNAFIPPVHLPCRKNCGSFYTEVFGGKDLSKFCKLECENIDPLELSKYIMEDITYVRDNRIRWR